MKARWLGRQSHMLASTAGREQNEVTGGISLVSNFLLTSCPVANEWLSQSPQCQTRWHAGLSSLFHRKLHHQKLVLKQQLTIRELWIVQFLLWPLTNSRVVCGYFSHYKKGKLSSFISLFACWFQCFSKSDGVSAKLIYFFLQSTWTLPSCGYFWGTGKI